MRTAELAMAVFLAIFPRLMQEEDRESMEALAEAAGRDLKSLVSQQGHSLIARGVHNGEPDRLHCKCTLEP